MRGFKIYNLALELLGGLREEGDLTQVVSFSPVALSYLRPSLFSSLIQSQLSLPLPITRYIRHVFLSTWGVLPVYDTLEICWIGPGLDFHFPQG